MGVSYHTYVGPYIQVHNPERIGTEKFQSCTNPQCKNHKKRCSDQFCSKCGSKIGVVEVPCKKRIQFDIYDEFQDNLTEIGNYGERGDDQIFVSNIEELGGGQTLYCENCEILPLTNCSISNEVWKMRQDFIKEIARLKEVFGVDNVTLQWGVVAYVC